MKIKTFKVEKHLGCPVYFRNFLNHFEYLTIIKGQLYTAHITVRPRWQRRLKVKLGLIISQYSKEEVEGIINQLRKMAESTVEFILKKENKR